ncbi:MAG: Re/Si-specific NAD(P)(+) transhydrogenase subunit alpha [Bacteroidia bacterium]|nr:Re/Si-specific NAD(P)(+) transhydrogenase subunit alpha [Bacteroidia bacterium]
MQLGIPKESKPGEKRVSVTPDVVKDFIKKGYEVLVESGAGSGASFSDQNYKDAGAQICDKATVFKSDAVLKINPPSSEEVEAMKSGAVLISLMYHLSNPSLVEACCRKGISAFSLDAIPRISRAQKMDVLSSQANLAGYKAVLMAANTIGKILPMMTTAAGTIRPCKVVIFGAGVAGLQAIATAKRLGAVVEVTDIRPETKEQVESLGGKFIEVKGDESIKIEGGYVKNVSEEFLKKQQELVAKHVKEADIVITTALIPGKKAPLLVTEEMVSSMRPGSVIVDMAVEQGGNVAGSELNKVVVKNGVHIIGEGNLPSLLPTNASELFAKNIQAFLYHLSDSKSFKWEVEEEITKGSLIVRDGKVVHPSLLQTQPA